MSFNYFFSTHHERGRLDERRTRIDKVMKFTLIVFFFERSLLKKDLIFALSFLTTASDRISAKVDDFVNFTQHLGSTFLLTSHYVIFEIAQKAKSCCCFFIFFL